LIALAPLQGSYCTACGEAFDVPAYSDRFAADRGETERLEADRVEVEIRCLLSERTGPPFERAVADASDDGGLRDLIRLLKFPQVRGARRRFRDACGPTRLPTWDGRCSDVITLPENISEQGVRIASA
jgi:hypothetical protein